MRGGGVFGLDAGTMNEYMQKYGHSSIRVIFIVYANLESSGYKYYKKHFCRIGFWNELTMNEL